VRHDDGALEPRVEIGDEVAELWSATDIVRSDPMDVSGADRTFRIDPA
jgi:hypothetical protein